MAASPVRVRFAPSPTGYLHVGGLRTALYNYLFARRNGGSFVLRIEDTDRTRFVPGAAEKLMETLAWAGLTYDEGPGKGGNSGPYVQSERTQIYKRYADKLLAAGHAYHCFCTPERLDEMRKQQEKEKSAFKYDRLCLRLSDPERAERLRAGVPAVVRLRVPDNETVRFNDVIRGDVEFTTERVDDQVLIKSDGYPTYHLANVVDDHLMGITHVIRGEEWLSSTPKHVLLYRAFGWDLPVFAHLPLLLNPDRSKLSKRQGDVAVEEYRDKGYLREALLNFIALLGWNPGNDQEFFTLEELIKEFSLEGVNKSGAIFSLDKLNWLNFEHMRRKSDGEMLKLLRDVLASSPYAGTTYDDAYLSKVIAAMRERTSFVKDILEKSPYFFTAPTSYEPEAVRKRWTPASVHAMELLAKAFAGVAAPTKEAFELALKEVAGSLGVPNGDLIHPLRLAISGLSGGPGVYDIAAILGQAETVRRIQSALRSIPKPA